MLFQERYTSYQLKEFIKEHERLKTTMYYKDGGKQSLTYTVEEKKEDEEGNETTLQVQKTLCCGNATIGYGHLIHEKPIVPDEAIDHADLKQLEAPYKNGITAAKATEIFESDIAKIERYLKSKIKVSITQAQFDGIMSFSFNAGPGNGYRKVIKKLNAGDIEGAENALRTSNTIDNRAIIKRRNQEADTFSEPIKYFFE